MSSTYSTNLGIELIGSGEQTGTWGTTTNTNLGTLLEQAISGYVTQAITDGSGANTTITIPDGATGVARNMFLELTGALTFSTTSLIVPANKKLYFIYNNTTGGFAVTVKVSGLTGVSVPNGRKVLLVSNGTDIVEAHNAISGNATVGGTLGVTGATTLSAALTYGGITLANAVTGTGNMVLATSPSLTTPLLGTPTSGVATNLTGLPLTTGVTGTLPVANGGTGAATLTSNNVLLGNGTSALQAVAPSTSGNLLTSNGTTWQSTAAAGNITLGTPVTSTSGTAINFTGIPTGTKRITINFNGVSTNGTSLLIVQIGPTTVPETTGYLSGASLQQNAGTNIYSSATTGFAATGGTQANSVVQGTLILSLESSANNSWIAAISGNDSGVAASIHGGGSKSLAAVCGCVRITTVGGSDTFDAGEINISYEK